MNLRPGTTLWLLRHELRLFWYQTFAPAKPGAPGAARRSNWRVLGGAMLVWCGLHAGVFALLHAAGPADALAPLQFVVAVSAILLATFLFMLSSALKASVETLFDRGDMDLLLSSPVSSRSIFGVKLGGMAFGVAGLYLFFLAPFAHVGLLLGQFRWMAIYPVLFAMAVLAASVAMLLTLLLVRLLGARRTRVVAQVLGALTGAFLFLLTQAGTFMSQESGQPSTAIVQIMAAAQSLDPQSLVLLPARAALGETEAVAVIAGLGLFCALLTVRSTHRFFVRGLQLAAGSKPVSRGTGPVRYRFDRGLMALVIAKEWRLVWRDAHLISQVLLQLLYLLPLCFLVFRKDALQLPAIAAGLTMLSGSLSAALSWIILLAEDAPDLLRTSPARSATIRMAKLAAAVVPVFGLVILPLLWLTVRAPLAGALTGVTVCGAVLGAALINLWTGRPTARGEFQSRGKGNVSTRLLELCSLLGWAALALLLPRAFSGAPASIAFAGALGAAAAVALGTLPLAWLLRARVR
jgi:ABC-2 type transport system permease protein